MGAVTLKEFNNWILRGKRDKRKYMISVCDTFSYDDYPVYCDNLEELADIRKRFTFESM